MEIKETNRNIARAFPEAEFSRQYVMSVHDEAVKRWNRKEKAIIDDKK